MAVDLRGCISAVGMRACGGTIGFTVLPLRRHRLRSPQPTLIAAHTPTSACCTIPHRHPRRPLLRWVCRDPLRRLFRSHAAGTRWSSNLGADGELRRGRQWGWGCVWKLSRPSLLRSSSYVRGATSGAGSGCSAGWLCFQGCGAGTAAEEKEEEVWEPAAGRAGRGWSAADEDSRGCGSSCCCARSRCSSP